MPDTESLPVWRFRLMLVTAVAVVVLAVIWLRARVDFTRVEKRRAAMLGSLRSLLAVQDANQARTGRFATSLDSLGSWQSPSELVFTFEARDATTWSATVYDSTLTVAPTRCGIFVGRPEASPHRAVVAAGSPACW